MRRVKPDEHLPSYLVPENEYDAEELECRESREDEDSEEEEEEEEDDDDDEPITEQDRIDAEGDRLYDEARDDGEL
jgi:hypothetical protein